MRIGWVSTGSIFRLSAERNSIGRPEVQGFVDSLVGLGATKGAFGTTSGFSRGAAEYAHNLP